MRPSRPKAHDEKAPPSRTTRLLRAATLAGIYGGLFMPLVFLSGLVVFPFVFLKLLFLQIVVALTLPAFLVLAWREPRYRPRFTWIYLALGGHLVALAMSAATAADRHHAFWGNQERMNGLFSLLHFVGWFAMASSVMISWRDWRKLLHWQAGLGFAMAVVALLQRPFPNLLGMEADSRVAGLLGNPIYLGAYQVFTVFWLALLWARAEKPSWRRSYALVIAVCAASLWASGSRGPLLGLFGGVALAFAIWAIGARRHRLLALEGAALVCMAAGYVLIARYLVPLPSLEEFWSRNKALQHVFLLDFDPARRHLWAVAWRAFHDRPWLGWGLTNYDIVFDVYSDPWFLCSEGGGTLHDSSHSLYLDHLSTTGVAGLATFLLLWLSTLAAVAGALRARRLELPAGAALIGMIASYLIQGIFVFDSPGVHSMTHLLLAFAVAVGQPAWSGPWPTAIPTKATPALFAQKFSVPLFLGLEIAGSLLAVRGSVLPGYASFTARKAHAAFGRGKCREALALARRAAAIPTPFLEDQMYMLCMNLGGLSENGLLGRCPEWHSVLDHGRALIGTLLEWCPTHSRQRWLWANLLAAVGSATRDPEILAEAGRELEAVLAVSPQRQQVRHRYAQWLAGVGRVAEAQAQLDLALSQGEAIGESLWRKGVFLWRYLDQGQAGAALMAQAVEGECRYVPRSPTEVQQLALAYATRGDRAHLRGIVRYVQDFSKDDRSTLVHLGIARYLDQHGLTSERDRVLQVALERDSGLAGRLKPWREGRVPLDAVERLYGGAPSAALRAENPPQGPPREPPSAEGRSPRPFAARAQAAP
jgi:O-antigen ligase